MKQHPKARAVSGILSLAGALCLLLLIQCSYTSSIPAAAEENLCMSRDQGEVLKLFPGKIWFSSAAPALAVVALLLGARSWRVPKGMALEWPGGESWVSRVTQGQDSPLSLGAAALSPESAGAGLGLSFVPCPLFLFLCPLSPVACPSSLISYPLSLFHCVLSLVPCPLFPAPFLLPLVPFPLSLVLHPLFLIACPLSLNPGPFSPYSFFLVPYSLFPVPYSLSPVPHPSPCRICRGSSKPQKRAGTAAPTPL